MQIIAKRGYGGLYYTPACISSPGLEGTAFIKFAIDTGATITSISSIDAHLNGIDCSKLQPLSPTFSATIPNIHTCFICDCKLGFISYDDNNNDNNDNDSLSIEELGQINVFCDIENITIQSVIGLNLLVNYKIYFSNDKTRMILRRCV
jgi:hypothetical protein